MPPRFLRNGKTCFLDVLEGLVGGKLAPVGPAEFRRLGKSGSDFLPRMLAGALGVLLALVELLEEEQDRKAARWRPADWKGRRTRACPRGNRPWSGVGDR